MAAVTIIGGHGKIALIVARILSSRGDTVTSWIRDPAQSEEIAATGATPRVLDVESATQEEIAAALAGADAIVFSAGAGGGNPERTYAVDRDAAIRSIHAAEQAGVKRYVMVSYLGAAPDHGVPESDPFFAYAEAKAAADVALRASDLDWTVLMPGRLTLDEPTGRVDPDATRSADNPGTSRANVALVVASVLDRPDTVGKDLPFTDGGTAIEKAWT
ncbi:NAD(P)H-binding protein [Tsukamurella spumae]|uniref:NAD(P)H-binding protein n=1 Tax=Tsukamurella spumae TaxID=44753 RepID=A0A846X4S8_9ACTN|nr:NAD(P)H-binding protein [Tsukamurella spumae]NKY20091.1 NAD(P)H-binding protein [Tsukamurella spumae]